LKIHFNLHTHDWSATAVAGARRGCVIASVTDITLTDAIFTVSTAGYLRAKRDRHRNVHAWVIGTVAAVDTRPDLTALVCVTYRPRPRDPHIEDSPGFRLRDRPSGSGPNITAAAQVVCAKTSPEAAHGYAWIPPRTC
jgi:hypothetical protein